MGFSRQVGSLDISLGNVMLQTLIRRAHHKHSGPAEERWGRGKGGKKHCFDLAVWTSPLKWSSYRVCWLVFVSLIQTRVTWEEAPSAEELSQSDWLMTMSVVAFA